MEGGWAGTRTLERLAESWLGVLLPELCRDCGCALGLRDVLLCPRCWLHLSWVRDGAVLADAARAWCGDHGFRFRRSWWPARVDGVRTRSVAYMEPVLATVIHHLKYRGRRRVARELAGWMARVLLSDPEYRSCDAVVAIPLRAEKVRERGCDPPALLAEGVGRRVGLPVLGRVLAKRIPTRSQTEVAPTDRPANPQGSFELTRPGAVRGGRVLLVDDVLTSGSTAAAAAGTLLDGGAREVLVLTAARTPTRPSPAGGKGPEPGAFFP